MKDLQDVSDRLGGGFNYRVFRDKGVFTIREVYYGKKGKPTAYTDPLEPMGESIEELKEDIWRMLMALYIPALTKQSFSRSRKKPNNRKLALKATTRD